jgi:hypothetical protein
VVSRGLASGGRVLSGGAGTGVRLGFSIVIAADPALVRTVRLVAAAVARRAVFDPDGDVLDSSQEGLVEEVRLAVGEACALLIGATRSGTSRDEAAVEVRLVADDRLRVVVTATGTAPLADQSLDGAPGDAAGVVEPWALLRGIVEDFRLTRDAEGTRVSMSWPLTP